jgi:hypothetical protein
MNGQVVLGVLTMAIKSQNERSKDDANDTYSSRAKEGIDLSLTVIDRKDRTNRFKVWIYIIEYRFRSE